MRDPEQLAFDIEGMIHAAQVEKTPPWTGAPLHFTTDYYSPTDLDAAREHWYFLHGPGPASRQSRMWHRAIAVPGGVQVGEHGFDMFTADLRCLEDAHRHERCACIGDLLHQVVCEPCGWNETTTGENSAVESWHDHALPGWRDLPIVPAHIRGNKRAKGWIEKNYPKHMQFPGAPVITERGGGGYRHVPGRSPWAGYDLSHTAVDPQHDVRRAWTPERRRESAHTIDGDLRI